MFDNIGGKTKGLAKSLCWVGIIISVAYAVYAIATGATINSRYGSNGEGDALVTSGLLVLVIGPLLSWVGSFALYAFGQLTQNSDLLNQKMDRISRQLDALRAGETMPAAGKEKETEKEKEEDAPAHVPAKAPDDVKKYMQIPLEERKKMGTHPVPIGDNQEMEKCGLCGTVQRAGRKICMNCAAQFIRDDAQA